MSDMGFPANFKPEVHVVDGDAPKLEVTFTPHGPVVNVTASLVKLALAAAGVWIASHAGESYAQLAVGAGVVVGSAWGLWDHLRGSNEVTKALFDRGPSRAG
jgi:hypothetical protein